LIVEPLFHKDWMEQFVARSDRYEFVVEALLIFYPTRGSICKEMDLPKLIGTAEPCSSQAELACIKHSYRAYNKTDAVQLGE
jgi:hypothetical protein